MPLPLVRRTKRLLLRMPVEADLDFVTALFARPELVAHRPDPRPDTPDASARRLSRDMDHWPHHGFGRWAVEADGRLIGFGGVTVSKEFDGLNLSYHLHPDSWGHGYATELVREALAFSFNDLHAERVIGLVRSVNVASRHVLEKCGFAFEREVMLHNAPTNLFVLTAYGQKV
ncbi:MULTISPECIES: GNAT family N-acetyltransferase [unclassified Rhizobium]|uniref:GNAT family N-acetyltransferase n=1 Tax=unclassified Rhizobium TaxID=2613769 RepID=UPI000CDF3342|nr:MULTISPECIES: GNAT family N-acetyltransferase [Rhizobium]AVA22512.1 GCN5-related N-acetyltransferase protein [Rhizobium sp. NXC24]MDK4738476.1 GNAT family N-acetyltransferase [Rhizobium sp. CNPSo 3464]UWU19900.1 GNAT family N-acetyltransferase [Rhizobium tropici]